MRVLVTGGAGLLGSSLIATRPLSVDLHATWRSSRVEGAEAHRVDVADAAATDALVARLRPKVVIHAAYSSAHESDVWEATRSVVAACAAYGVRLVHVSTDALLDGESAPYDESAEPAPVHEYGRWKARAELHVREALPGAAVVRTSLITRLDPPDRATAAVLDALRRGKPVKLFVDEMRCPIHPDDLAAQIWEVAALPGREAAGVWNLVGPEALSRYAIGVLVAAKHRLDPAGIVPTVSAGSGIARPRDLRLTTVRADRALRARPRTLSAQLLPSG